MFRWIPFAMVRITLFLVAGILFGIYWPGLIAAKTGYIALIILILTYFLIWFILKGKQSLKMVAGLTGLTAVALVGYLNLFNRTDSNWPTHISRLHKPVDFYLAEIKGMEERTKVLKIEVAIKRVKSGSEWMDITGRSLLYVSEKSGTMDWQYGDEIIVAGSPSEVPPPANPGEFDFRRFLSLKNISHQQFVSGQQIRRVSQADHKGLLFYSDQVRKWAAVKIKEFIPGPREQVIALALVLGVTDGIDNDLQSAYAASGAMHILSVSGLHVGIIYAIILFLLKPLAGQSWSRWLIAGLSLVCLWAYAFVTGLSPSVLRAVTMFSFIAIARPFARDTNIYNTLAASAFLLLLYDPYLILSVGFQLSYLAVLGIVYLYRPLYNLWEPGSWLGDKAWQVTCVSLAAQLATFALGLFYFHQFPVYFLISNIIVVPLSGIILVAGVVLLGVSGIPVLAGWIGIALHGLISLLNESVFFVEKLPFSLIGGVQITFVECCLILGIIVLVIRLFESGKFRFAVGSCFVVALLILSQWWRMMREYPEKLVVYKVKGHSAGEWITGHHSFFYPDTALLSDEAQVRFHIQPHRLLSGINETNVHVNDPHWVRYFSGFRFFLLEGASVLWIDEKHAVLPQGIAADYLVIGNNSVGSLELLQKQVTFRYLILDSSNSSYYSDTIAREAGLKGISVHSVMGQGAFVVNL